MRYAPLRRCNWTTEEFVTITKRVTDDSSWLIDSSFQYPRSWALNMALVNEVSRTRGNGGNGITDTSNLVLIIICMQRCSGAVNRRGLFNILEACI